MLLVCPALTWVWVPCTLLLSAPAAALSLAACRTPFSKAACCLQARNSVKRGPADGVDCLMQFNTRKTKNCSSGSPTVRRYTCGRGCGQGSKKSGSPKRQAVAHLNPNPLFNSLTSWRTLLWKTPPPFGAELVVPLVDKRGESEFGAMGLLALATKSGSGHST
jgi:hypothetical protein